MELLIVGGAIAGVMVVIIAANWMRGSSGGSGIEPWMLRIEGLTGLCHDYLGYIDEMNGSGHDYETLRYFDSQRQVTHEQLLDALGLDRSHPLDMAIFARRYLKG
ncbi:hypothetical protein EKD04_018020 [Chloroflexales bacterium ZM16-3]|nr:hypothetical protein [Chloroflexales bacterium ZM16-3]